jgi:hypothetical protein
MGTENMQCSTYPCAAAIDDKSREDSGADLLRYCRVDVDINLEER